ncbi:DUF3267 domain-containing protein [Acetivibrio saccincola]|uniref:DUF3267 domain-containing protein n=1 Tax=Acetivibrio saccincola TaxID=1677857 RepID=A0A2K9EGN2_9FIRM|nr:DUF3267 domain-containing protein [Acetivibrio saccincola]AUG58375.1 hypothetical protein HVS_12510 [Acetivibrio saccincola]
MTKIGEFKLNKTNSLVINLISLLVFVLATSAFLKLYNLNFLNYILNINFLLLIFCLFVIIIILHEFIHGIAYKFFGAKLKFGFKHLNIYTADTSGNVYGTKEMFVIMFSPLLFLSVLFIILSYFFKKTYFYFAFCTIFNMACSIGDIILFIYMLSKGGDCKIKDTNHGFLMYKKS